MKKELVLPIGVILVLSCSLNSFAGFEPALSQAYAQIQTVRSEQLRAKDARLVEETNKVMEDVVALIATAKDLRNRAVDLNQSILNHGPADRFKPSVDSLIRDMNSVGDRIKLAQTAVLDISMSAQAGDADMAEPAQLLYASAYDLHRMMHGDDWAQGGALQDFGVLIIELKRIAQLNVEARDLQISVGEADSRADLLEFYSMHLRKQVR